MRPPEAGVLFVPDVSVELLPGQKAPLHIVVGDVVLPNIPVMPPEVGVLPVPGELFVLRDPVTLPGVLPDLSLPVPVTTPGVLPDLSLPVPVTVPPVVVPPVIPFINLDTPEPIALFTLVTPLHKAFAGPLPFPQLLGLDVSKGVVWPDKSLGAQGAPDEVSQPPFMIGFVVDT